MRRCAMVACVSMWLAAARGGVVYEVALPMPQTQMVDLVAEFDLSGLTLEDGELEVHLPVWRPGLYVVLDQAGTVREVSATDGEGSPLEVRKSAKSTWRVRTNGADTVRFAYRIYANSIENRTRHVDATHAYLSGSSVFVYVDALRDEPAEVRVVEMPGDWRVATGLERVGENRFRARNYDILVDSPLEIGEHDLVDFEVAGVPHEVAIWGRWDGDAQRVREAFRAIGEVQLAIFGSLPYDRYVYLIHSAEGLRGGTEHYNSTICHTEPSMWGDQERWERFLTLIAHELFHVWNVKRFRPAGIARYDYLRENYTELLWVVEGSTSYYDELTLPRAGLVPAATYLRWLGDSINGHMAAPGRTLESLEDSSFDAWIKHFHRGADRRPDRHNQGESFYRKGALVSLMLDLEIRRATEGRRSLDDVMRMLSERFPLGGAGYTTDDLRAIIEEVGGARLDAFFDRYVAGVEAIEGRLGELLGDVGLRLVSAEDDAAGAVAAFTGLEVDGEGRVQRIRSDGPAYAAGVLPGDEVVAVNGLRGRGDTAARLGNLEPGDRVALVLMRRDEMREIAFDAGSRPDGSWRVESMAEADEAQRRAFESWLGLAHPADETRE